MKWLSILVCLLLLASVVSADASCLPLEGRYFMRADIRAGTCKSFKGVITLEDVQNTFVSCKGTYTVLETPTECGWEMDLSCVDRDPETKLPLGRIVQKGKILRESNRILRGQLEITSLTIKGELLCSGLYDVVYKEL